MGNIHNTRSDRCLWEATPGMAEVGRRRRPKPGVGVRGSEKANILSFGRNKVLFFEFLGQTLFWNSLDLEEQLVDYQAYNNYHRTHKSFGGDTLAEFAGVGTKLPIKLNRFRWQSHCRGIDQLPIAA